MYRESIRLIGEIKSGFEQAVQDGAVRKIIYNSIEVFSRKGFTAARISDIAELAGFSQGFVYNHFKSKDDVFTAIAALAADGAPRAVNCVREYDGSGYMKLYWLTEALLSPDCLAGKHFSFILLCAAAPESIPQKAREILSQSAPKPIEALSPVIVQGQNEGEIIMRNPIELAIAYFSFIQGYITTLMQSGSGSMAPLPDLILGFLKAKMEVSYGQGI